MIKLVLDTNVLIYGFDAQSSYFSSAVSILSEPNHDLFIPAKVISEFFAVCSKLDIPFTHTLGFYEELCQNGTVLYPNSVSLDIFESLMKKYQPKGNRVFDLEIIAVALANNIENIATANLKDFNAISEIKVHPLIRNEI